MNPLSLVRYVIGAGDKASEVPGRVTMYGYGVVNSPSAKYVNLYSENGEVPEYGPYLPRTRTASKYEEGVPNPDGMGFWRNLDDQLYVAVLGKAKYVETDNRDAYRNSVILKVFDTAAKTGLSVICKNPGMSDHDEDSTELLKHSAVVSSIIEKGDVTATQYHKMRVFAGKSELPVTFVAFKDDDDTEDGELTGREWAVLIAAEIRTHQYVNMGVTYDRANEEYGGDIEDILKLFPSVFEPGAVLPNIGNSMAWRVAKSLETLREQVNAKWLGRDKSNDGTIGDTSHQATKSDHNPNASGVVTAMDITDDPSHGLVARALAETLVASRDQRIKYIISNAQIISSLVSPWVWRPYSGSNAHRQHVHISVMAEPLLYDDPKPWSLGSPVTPARPSSVRRFTEITATEFGGSNDPNNSAYDNHFIDDDEFGVALPFRFKGARPKVRVFKGGQAVVCEIVDVGPWNINDPYWETGSRPQAETGTDNTGRRTNNAGIDLTPAAASAIGLNGLGKVDWEFVADPVIIPQKPTGNPHMPGNVVPFNPISSENEFLEEIRPIARRYMTGSTQAGPVDQFRDMLLSLGWTPPVKAETATTADPLQPVLQQPAVQVTGTASAAAIIAQLAGLLPASIGPNSTTAGILTTAIPLALTLLSPTGVFGKVWSLIRGK